MHRMLPSPLLLLLLFAALALLPTPAPLAAPIVQDVRVQGLESIEESAVLEVIQSEPGTPLDPEMLQSDQRAIINIGIFDPAHVQVFAEELPQGAGVNLIFTVQENPVVSRIEIFGNVAEPTERLESFIDQRVGERLISGTEREIQTVLVDYYRRQGHANARVIVNRAPQDDGTVALLVEVREGDVMEIGDVEIEGNEEFSDFRLRLQMSTRPSGVLGTNYFSDEIFEADLIALQEYLFGRGYLDATVERGTFRHDREEGTITPVVVIDEGPRYRFDGVDVRGNTLFTDLEITSLFDDISGRWFRAEPLRSRLEQIRTMYGDEGHVNASVEPRFDPDPATGVVHLTLDIREGQRVAVGDIYLQRTLPPPDLEPPVSAFLSSVAERFNRPVTDDTVRRFIALEEGEVYRTYQEVRTVERLRRLGIFEEVTFDRRPTADPTVEDVFLTVEERPTGLLTVGAGLGDESGLFGFVRLTERNLSGEADQIRASVMLGTRVLNFDVTYFNRFLADTDISLRLSGYDREMGRDEYDEERTGASLEFGQPLTEYLQIYYGARAEYVSFDLDDTASSDTRDAMGSYVLGLAHVRLEEDTRDDVTWPTRGWLRSASLEGGWADSWLLRLRGEFQWYHRIWRDVIFAANLQAGLIPRDLDDVAFGERFFLGGSEDLRGFEYRGAGPTDSVNDDLFTGGTTKLLSQMEIRFPIYGQLRGLTFFDVGSLGEDPFELEPLRASVGIGLRFTFPRFRSIALDVAQAVASRGDDDKQTIHFTFRTDF